MEPEHLAKWCIQGFIKALISGGHSVLEKSLRHIHGYEVFSTSLVQNEICRAETPDWIQIWKCFLCFNLHLYVCQNCVVLFSYFFFFPETGLRWWLLVISSLFHLNSFFSGTVTSPCWSHFGSFSPIWKTTCVMTWPSLVFSFLSIVHLQNSSLLRKTELL